MFISLSVLQSYKKVWENSANKTEEKEYKPQQDFQSPSSLLSICLANLMRGQNKDI